MKKSTHERKSSGTIAGRTVLHPAVNEAQAMKDANLFGTAASNQQAQSPLQEMRSFPLQSSTGFHCHAILLALLGTQLQMCDQIHFFIKFCFCAYIVARAPSRST
jgi:hypothetical protein